MSQVNIEIIYNSSFGSRGVGNSQFQYPTAGIVIGAELFIVDKQNHRIQVFDLAGNYIRQFGTVGTGNDQFTFPEGITTDGAVLIICDGGNHRIKYHSTNGTFISQWGTKGSGDNQLNYPKSIKADIDGNFLMVADNQNHRVKVTDIQGAFIKHYGLTGAVQYRPRFPEGTIYANNMTYIVDSANKRITVFSPPVFGQDDNYIKTLDGSYEYPVAMTKMDTFLVITDRVNAQLHIYDEDDNLVTTFGSQGAGIDQFYYPQDVIYHNGKMYVVDSGNHRINVYDVYIEQDIPKYLDSIMKLTLQLYPKGRVWWLSKDSVFNKLHSGLAYSEARALEEAHNLLESIIPDNDVFTETDATNWERALGLYYGQANSLDDRKQSITRAMAAPNNVLPKQNYRYFQQQLQLAGFNVYVHENTSLIFPGSAIYGVGIFGATVYNNTGYDYSLIGNEIDEAKEIQFSFDYIKLRNTFFIGGEVFGTNAEVLATRKNEFRELILRIKPAQTVGILLINYT